MMVDLETLIRAGEGERTEFKAQWSDTALETLAAFANGRGGTLLVGVDDDGRVIGWQGNEQDLRATTDRIANALRIQPSLEVRVLSGERVLVIDVSPSGTPIAYRGRYYRRIGNTTRQIPPEELGRLFIEKWGVTWDSVTSDYSVDEIDSDTVQQFARLSKPRLPYVSEDEASESLLRKLDLLVDGKLTRGAVLLFGKEPQRHFLMTQVHMGRFKTDTTIVDDKLIRGNLFRQLEQVMQFFRQYLQVRYEIPGEMGEAASPLEALQRREIWDYPLEALREAVINALIHRDYFDPHREISIRVYDDRVYVWSPGELPPGITVEDLKRSPHDSSLRNPLLAQVFYFAGWIERWGSGTTRIVELCRRQGLPEPDFRSEKGRFEVVFYQDPYTGERLREMGLNERQVKAVLYVKEQGSITNREFRELTGLSDEATRKDLAELTEKGLLRVEGKGRSTRYVFPKPGD
jgi:ATP-dependent DNA helicase RecG